MRSPLNKISPEVISISPVIIFIVVDLPDPFGPRYPVTSPARAEKLTLSTAVILEKHFETERSSSMDLLLDTKPARKVPLIWMWISVTAPQDLTQLLINWR